jgi:hypothetical protein
MQPMITTKDIVTNRYHVVKQARGSQSKDYEHKD